MKIEAEQNRAFTVNEREEAAIGLIIVDEEPLILGLKISSERNQVGMSKPAHRLHVPLEHLSASPAQLPGLQPLHAHNQTVVQHRLVRRPDGAFPQQLRRGPHQLVQRVHLRLAGAEH